MNDRQRSESFLVEQSVPGERLDTSEYPSEWQTLYSIDSMLEHAVMHPIRHTFQLEELMRALMQPGSDLRGRDSKPCFTL